MLARHLRKRQNSVSQQRKHKRNSVVPIISATSHASGRKARQGRGNRQAQKKAVSSRKWAQAAAVRTQGRGKAKAEAEKREGEK